MIKKEKPFWWTKGIRFSFNCSFFFSVFFFFFSSQQFCCRKYSKIFLLYICIFFILFFFLRKWQPNFYLRRLNTMSLSCAMCGTQNLYERKNKQQFTNDFMLRLRCLHSSQTFLSSAQSLTLSFFLSDNHCDSIIFLSDNHPGSVFFWLGNHHVFIISDKIIFVYQHHSITLISDYDVLEWLQTCQ